MKLATRINSFLPVYDNSLDKIFNEFSRLGLTHVELNFPEHTNKYTPSEMKDLLSKHNLLSNGVALRFRNEFINGELGNSNPSIAKDALDLCKKAADYCREIGGKIVTIWLGFDGFDYSFQLNYKKVWEQIKNAFIEITDYAPDMMFSIEYKPFQPRAYSFIDSLGLTMVMLNDVNKDNLGVTLDYCHMLMKHENPAYGADMLGARKKLFGVHLNDGYGLNDDGLMIGTSTPLKTLEFLYYVKLHNYENAIYFDTFPVIENAALECEKNIAMIKLLSNKIDKIGIEKIGQIIDSNDAIKATELMIEFMS